MGRGPWAVLCQRLPASLPLAALRPDACLDISLRTLRGLELDALTARLRFNRVGLRARTYHAGCLRAQTPTSIYTLALSRVYVVTAPDVIGAVGDVAA